ncbi:hypothetical protein ACFODZ_02965 [Marinicella sediminis]|uniref:Uncharacterized protein n=1 Tax=Marinicella sediminis TaxID=1792834 RepID=A0ABV7J973_9GAMM|nr:hypothetical protein [Marinicella sediminis]
MYVFRGVVENNNGDGITVSANRDYYWSIGSEYAMTTVFSIDENTPGHKISAGKVIYRISAEHAEKVKRIKSAIKEGTDIADIDFSDHVTACVAKDLTLYEVNKSNLSLAIEEIHTQNKILRKNLSTSLSLQLDVIDAELMSLLINLENINQTPKQKSVIKEKVENLSNTVLQIKENLMGAKHD